MGKHLKTNDGTLEMLRLVQAVCVCGVGVAHPLSNLHWLCVPCWHVLSELTGRATRGEPGSSSGSGSKPRAQVQPPPQPEEDGKYVKAIVNKQYNTPIGLYSHTNAEDTLVEQSKEILTMIG